MIVRNAIDREGCQPSHLETRKEPSNRAEAFGVSTVVGLDTSHVWQLGSLSLWSPVHFLLEILLSFWTIPGLRY